MTYSIKIYDSNKTSLIGELPNADTTTIIKYLDKGFIVTDFITDEEITKESLINTIGVSECII